MKAQLQQNIENHPNLVLLETERQETETETSEIKFRVFGTPAPQGSKTYVGRGIMIEASKKVAPWRADVVAASKLNFHLEPIEVPVKVELNFFIERPKSHFRTGKFSEFLKTVAPFWPTSKSVGDLDKLARSTIDALSVTSGGRVIADDSLITRLVAGKEYVMTEPAGCLVRVVKLV